METKGNIYGYIRVSTLAQHDDRQWVAMDSFGVPRECVFADKQSGKDFDCPAYNELLAHLKYGDTLVVNIKTRYLIQSQTRVQTSEVLATRAFEVFCIFR